MSYRYIESLIEVPLVNVEDYQSRGFETRGFDFEEGAIDFIKQLEDMKRYDVSSIISIAGFDLLSGKVVVVYKHYVSYT